MDSFNAPYCTECGKPCKLTVVDFGNGPYEFWGQRGIDTDKQTVSDCCEAEVSEGPPEKPPVEEVL